MTATSLGQEPTHLCVDFLLLSQQLEREMGISLGNEWPPGAHQLPITSQGMTHMISAIHESHSKAVPSPVNNCAQTAQHLHPAQQHSSNNVGCHSLAFHRVAECCQIQQRDTSQASSLDWSSTLVYVVKLKEINIHYPHK